LCVPYMVNDAGLTSAANLCRLPSSAEKAHDASGMGRKPTSRVSLHQSPAESGKTLRNAIAEKTVETVRMNRCRFFRHAMVALTPKTVVVMRGNANWDSAFDTLIDSFKALSALLDKQGIKPAGNSMIVYTATDDTGFTYLAEIPVEQEPKNLGKDMSTGKSPEGKALKFVHRGSYDNMDNTYEAITNHLDDKKLEAKDTFVEEYVTDPLKTAEDKLVINVYVPLK